MSDNDRPGLLDGWRVHDKPDERLLAMIFDRTWLYPIGYGLIAHSLDDEDAVLTLPQRFGLFLLGINEWWITRKRRVFSSHVQHQLREEHKPKASASS